MQSHIGILSGRHSIETVCETLRALGHVVVPYPDSRSEGYAIRSGRSFHEPFRAYTDEHHLTFRRVLEHPHTIVEIAHTSANEAIMRALVARFGGWVRRMGQNDPTPVRPDADVDNPAYDLRIDLQDALPEEEITVARALARIGLEDRDTLERVQVMIERYLARRPGVSDQPEFAGPGPC